MSCNRPICPSCLPQPPQQAQYQQYYDKKEAGLLSSNCACSQDPNKYFGMATEQNEKCDNLTAVLHGINDLRLEQRPMRQPKDNEVLLQMESVGICGSDVHYLVNGRIGHFIVTSPMVMGHEASGTVVMAGKNVKSLKPGDRVAIEPGVPCRVCKFCKTGRYNLCPEMRFCATPPHDGNLCRYYAHPEDFCFKLPHHISLDEGALLEPLSVGVHACKKGCVTVGSKVLVLGSGPIGLVSLLVAKAYGARRIVVTDLCENRLKVAKRLGADATLLVNLCDDSEVICEQILKMMGDQPDITIDCSGAEVNMKIAINITKSGGKAVLVGMGQPEVKLPLINALAREVDLIGCFRYVNDYADALELVASGKVNVKPLVTHHFKIEDTNAAFKTAQCPNAKSIKVIIHANKKWAPC